MSDVADSLGNLAQHFEYFPFGEIIKVTNKLHEDISSVWNIRTSYTFTNREYDEESGLYYYRARYYDASTGRFLQVDPDSGSLENPVSHNFKYIYAANSPAGYIDSDGMSPTAADYGTMIYLGGSLLFGDSGFPLVDYGNWCGWKVAPGEQGKDPTPVNNLDSRCRKHDLELIEAANADSVWAEGYMYPVLNNIVASYDYSIYHYRRSVADFRLAFTMLNHRNWEGKPLQYPDRFIRSYVMFGVFATKGASEYFDPKQVAFNVVSWGFSKNGKAYLNGMLSWYSKLF